MPQRGGWWNVSRNEGQAAALTWGSLWGDIKERKKEECNTSEQEQGERTGLRYAYGRGSEKEKEPKDREQKDNKGKKNTGSRSQRQGGSPNGKAIDEAGGEKKPENL